MAGPIPVTDVVVLDTAHHMMCRFRLLAASVAIVAMVSSAWLAVTHDLSDDTACFPDGTNSLHFAGPLRVAASKGNPTSSHCEICHWLRSLRSRETQAADLIALIAPLGILSASSVVSEAHHDAVRLPARAPPFTA
jgi:hypothetical protein